MARLEKTVARAVHHKGQADAVEMDVTLLAIFRPMIAPATRLFRVAARAGTVGLVVLAAMAGAVAKAAMAGTVPVVTVTMDAKGMGAMPGGEVMAAMVVLVGMAVEGEMVATGVV
ncbi:hypothetical protein J8C02_03675 [Chloracidobacterium sp. MS 40/45]|uniref:hypothetical protein n=1 Tax=Chloracidobacterium aggregatum TaxID=2851959 RepID=UPI001B8A8DA2|nr:hypothetical protein [Chloracidobacterium aggregatum]QUW01079.1 hypothetical protein J8C02_03675 [Chloracidobacterium sp. MS 40/45]